VSNNDSFIDEVSDEVRRDRLYSLMRRYGWIAIMAVVVLVGAAAWREYQRSQAEAAAQAFGDAVTAALESEDSAARIEALSAITLPKPDSAVVLDMLIAAEQANAGEDAAATETLQGIATQSATPEIYRQIAGFKALARGHDSLSVDERRIGFEAMTVPGDPLRLLAEEQLALIDIETGDTAAALERLQGIITDSEVTAGLLRRASQLIVSLGGDFGAT
jgi:hypothetical protein